MKLAPWVVQEDASPAKASSSPPSPLRPVTIESAGQYPAKDLLPAATTVLLEKVRTLRSALDGL